jgi:hypothetical protein
MVATRGEWRWRISGERWRLRPSCRFFGVEQSDEVRMVRVIVERELDQPLHAGAGCQFTKVELHFGGADFVVGAF